MNGQCQKNAQKFSESFSFLITMTTTMTSMTTTMTQIPVEYMERYRQFIKRNRFILKLCEDSLSRLVIYAPNRFVSHSEDDDDDDNMDVGNNNSKKKILPETLYALINLWSLFNDAIYHGFGEGNGMTVGHASSFRDHGGGDHGCTTSESGRNMRRKFAVIFLRSILSVVECMAPALEVSAYMRRRTASNSTTSSSISSATRSRRTNQNAERRHHSQHFAHLNALSISAKLERIKFMCRLGLLSLHYIPMLQDGYGRSEGGTKKSKSGSGGGSSGDDHHQLLLTTGILQDGGLLAPNEYVTSMKDERNRVKKLLYVGKRTGRKIGYTTNTYHHRYYRENTDRSKTSSTTTTTTAETSECVHANAQQQRRRTKWYHHHQCVEILESPGFKFASVAMGELLHIARPLYYIYSYLRYESNKNSHTETNQRRREKMRMLKSLVISLCMDLLSHKLTEMGKRAGHPAAHRGRKSHSHHPDIDISSESTKEELYRRKMRWTMYLLRAPVWELLTHPVCETTAGIIGCVPLVGRPVVQYVMDILIYWQRWHFMQEG